MSILCNVAVNPLAAVSVVAALAALAEAALFPSWVCAALPVNKLAVAVASLMAKAASFAAELPAATFHTAPWHPGAVLAWYFGLVCFAAWLHRTDGDA